MDAQDNAELERAERGREFWKPFCLAGWDLCGWTDDRSALFLRGPRESLDMSRGHVEIIRQAEQAAREQALEECEKIAYDHAKFCYHEADNGGSRDLYERASGAAYLQDQIRALKAQP